MRLLHPIRLGGLLAVIAAGTLGVLAVTKSTQATPVAGEYSMEVNIAATQANVGDTFVAQLAIVHGGVTDPIDCFDGLVNGIDDDADTVVDEADEAGLGQPFSDPASSSGGVVPFGCYAGVRWHLEYNETLVDLPGTGYDIAGMVKVAAAPANCDFKYDGDSNAQTICYSTSRAVLAYTGPAWDLTFTCTAAGFADFTLSITNAGTSVADATAKLPIHTHSDSIECGTGGPTRTPTPTHTPTPTITPTATPTATIHPRNTNTPVATTTSTAQQNMFAINPSVCLALQGAAGFSQCLSIAFPNSVANGGNRADLLSTIDAIQGDDDGTIERSELVELATFTGNHIHTIDGSLAIIAFVDDDDPVKFETTAGTFLINPVPFKDDEFVCGTSETSTLTGDEDCDHDGVAGDGVIFAQLLGNGEPIGTKGTVTAYNTITGEVVGDFFFEVVGEAEALTLDASETAVGGALPDVNGDTIVNYADCRLPGDVPGFLAAIDDPNKTAIFGRVHDKTGQNIIGSWVEWSVDNPALGVLAAPQTPTLNFGSFGFGAPQVFCGIGGAGTVKVRGKIVSGPFGITLDPYIQPAEFEVTITLLGKPTTMNLTVTPAVLNCDGVASATVSANVFTAAGGSAANGTEVAWSAGLLGTASPLTSKLADGTASTQVTPFAATNMGVPVIASVGPKTLITHPLETVNDGFDDDQDGIVDDRGSLYNPAEFDADIDIVLPNPDYFEVSTLVQCGADPTATPTHTPTSTSTPTATPTATFTPTSGCFGDVNGDGKVTGRDVAIVARALARQDNPDADVNHDGKVSLLDLTLVIKAMHANAC